MASKKSTKGKKAKPRGGVRKKEKCPYCDYTCLGKQGIARHVNSKHSTLSPKADPLIPVRRSEIAATLGILSRLADASPDSKETKEAMSKIYRVATTVKLVLAFVGQDLAVRVVNYMEVLKRLDELLFEKAKEANLKLMTPEELLRFTKMFNEIATMMIRQLRDIATLRETPGQSVLGAAHQLIEHVWDDAGDMAASVGAVVQVSQRDKENLFAFVQAEIKKVNRGGAVGVKPDSKTVR